MKSLPSDRQFYILERFAELSQLPANCDSIKTYKKIILLKNVYNEQRCVMKVQPKQLLETKQRNVLHQASFYQKFQGHTGVPLMIWSGQDFDCLILIIEELGLSIYDRMKLYSPQKKMRVKDACMIGIQLFDIVKNFHQKDYLHKNINPQTFCFGRTQKVTKLYASDLLYMKKFKAKNGLNHIQQKQNLKLQYLTPFLSKNVLSGRQASRRDDIISIVYVIIYLMKGKLPWQEDWEDEINMKEQEVKQVNLKNQNINYIFRTNVTTNNDHPQSQITRRIERMRTLQCSLTSQQLCQQLPLEINQLLQFANDLQFTQQPQYFRYIALLKKTLFKLKQKNDSIYEWMQSKENIDRNLKADTNVLRLSTERERQLLEIVYQPFENKVNLDNQYEEKLVKSVRPSMSYSIGKVRQQTQQKQVKNNMKKRNSYNQLDKKKNCQLI